MEYLIAFIIAVGLNMLMFIPAFIFKTDKLTDLSYAISFAMVSAILFFNSTQELGHILLLSMVVLWALRLGTYLFIRIRKIKRDKRFDGMRESFSRFFKFWFFQGVTVFVVLLAAIPYFSSTVIETSSLAIFGIVVFLFGLIVETFADLQKYKFINNPENKGKWIDEGLWHYSRHPNYFGEITLWTGVYLFTLSTISGLDAVVGIISPIYIAFIIIFVSGIPLLEKGANKVWGDNPEYQKYKETTSSLIILPKKRS
jgi:steroid 5-alpha reductase family enzyme